MKFLNKAIAYILCFALILNLSTLAYGAELIDSADEIHSYIVPVISNEYLEFSVAFYEFDGKYYLDLEDIKDFTRCTLTEDEETITLTHGLREIVIDKATGHMTDSDIVDQGNITLLEYEGKYLCEGIPMLIYLGASCAIKEDRALEVLMPSFTIWESIMPDYLDYYFNINELYGGEDNVKISLICDIIADVLDGVSGHGLMANADMHLEDALYEVLNVDMMKYASVQEAAATQNQKINDFLSSAVFGTILDTGDNTYDAVYEALDYYSRFYVSAKNDILLDMMTQTDDLDYASELASQIKEQVYAQSAAKANLKNAKTAQSFMDIGMLAFDTAITSYSMMQYDDDTRNLFARTINQGMFEYADYYDISWNNVSDKISNTLKSTQSIVANTAIENVAKFAVEKVTEEGAKSALSAFTSKANIYAAAAQIGFFIASLINYESNQAFSADMNAIWLSAVQYDVAMLVSSLLIKERDEFQFSSAESLEKLKDMFTLYYRITIAFSENIAKSIEEFGTKNDQKWVAWFSSTTEASVGNYAAIYLYRITNCEIVPIVKFSGISDGIITYDWISNVKVDCSNLVTDAFAEDCTYTAKMYNYDTGKSEETEITCIYRIPQINLSTSEAERINAEIYDALSPVIKSSVSEIAEYSYPLSSEEISYRWAVNGDILSLVVLNRSAPDFGGGDEYMVYNIAISSGTIVSDTSVVEAAGLSEAAFYEKAKQVLGSSFWANWDPSNENFGYQSFVDFFNEQLNRTISDDNIDQSYPYINENGQLCIIAKKYSLAAGDYYWHDLNMVEFELSPYYASEAGKIIHAINISEDEAYEIACDYWDYSEGDVSDESGFELYLVYDGLLEKSDGNHYYAYRLRWWVPENNMMSTVDYVYINAETGECSYSV